MAGYPNPSVGGTVAPSEFSDAYLRFLSGLQGQVNPQILQQAGMSSPQSLVEQAAAPVGEASAPTGRIAGKVAGLKNFLSDMGSVKSGEMSLPEFLAEHGTSLEGFGLPIASQLAANPVGNFLGQQTGNADFGHFAGSVIKDAGIGAGIGSFVPVIGTGLGAAAGGAIGALLGSKHQATQGEQLAGMENQAWSGLAGMGVDPATIKSVQGEYQTLKSTQGVNAATSYLNQVYQYQGQNSQQSLPGLPNATTGLDPAHIMAIQSSITGLMAPYMQGEQKANDAQINAFMQAATPAGQKISAATQHLGDLYKANNDEITNSYILQAQGEPFLNVLASSAYNKGILAQSGAGSSGASLASLLTGNAGVASGSSSGQASVAPASTAANYGANNPVLIQ